MVIPDCYIVDNEVDDFPVAHNFALRHIPGEWIIFLNADIVF